MNARIREILVSIWIKQSNTILYKKELVRCIMHLYMYQ